MADYWHLWLGALFCRREAYEYQRERKDAFAHGALFIVILGVIVALAGIAGAALRYAAGPSTDAVKNVVLSHLQAMPFYSQSIQPFPSAESQFLSGYNNFWTYAGPAILGYPNSTSGWTSLLAGVITTPILLLISWLVYGFLAHLIAGRSNPNVGLAHGLGTLALATSPQALAIIGILPQAGVSPLVIGLWTIILNVFAIRTAYQITTGRALWAALFPLFLLMILVILLSCFGLVALALIGGLRG